VTSDEQERLNRFMRLMAREIDANAHKGDRASRLPVVSRELGVARSTVRARAKKAGAL